ncbi:MAG: hypothetical protein RJB62_1961, partial [Pseudomonadota bacterium]
MVVAQLALLTAHLLGRSFQGKIEGRVDFACFAMALKIDPVSYKNRNIGA